MGGGGQGEWGSKLPISFQYLAQGEGQGGGFRSFPLLDNYMRTVGGTNPHTVTFALCAITLGERDAGTDTTPLSNTGLDNLYVYLVYSDMQRQRVFVRFLED